MKALLLRMRFVAAAGAAAAQTYDPTKTFSPLTLPKPVKSIPLQQWRAGPRLLAEQRAGTLA